MKIDEQTRKLVFDLYGIKAISRETGLRIFEKALHYRKADLLL
jgi:hypothetical protein